MPEENNRLDAYIAHLHPSQSRSSSAKLIKSGQVKVNNKVQTKPSYLVKPSDKIEAAVALDDSIVKKIQLPIIYEDEDCVVIDKPVGILSHSKGKYNNEPTVATWLSSRTSGLEGNRAGIVHRLDRGTSGVMICAKNPEALSWLQKQFSLRKTKKTYIAIVKGALNKPKAIIELPIERNPKKPQSFRVGANGKTAITEYEVQKNNDQLSQLMLQPKTGRTHQLRVHLSYLGHPIVGDELYGGPKADRLYLHALSLELTLPDKSRRIFESPLPKEFKLVFK